MRSATKAMRSGSGRLASAVKARPSCGGSGCLNAMAPASTRPSSSGSTTCMARSAAPSPRALSRQAARLVVAITTCSTGTFGAVERRQLAWLAAGGKSGRREDDGGREPRERRANEFRRVGILEAGDDKRRRRQAARCQRRAERVDRGGVGRKQQRAVEDDRRHRRSGRVACAASRSRSTAPIAGQITGSCAEPAAAPAHRRDPACRASRRSSARRFSRPPSRKNPAESRAHAAEASMFPRAADRRDPRRAAARARCRARVQEPRAARRHSATSRGRRAGEPGSPWRARRRGRSRDRPTWDGAGRADARAARSAGHRARSPTRPRAPQGRCRQTTI